MTCLFTRCVDRIAVLICALGVIAFGVLSAEALALPAFARQTGQNCVSCHAGGQFPELTPYGRMSKMTGRTIGKRAVPLSVMGVASYAKVRDTSKSDDPAADFAKNGAPIFATGSVFLAGKLTDNIGLFSQTTYDNYAARSAQGAFQGHSSMDNFDLRYADRFIDGDHDLVVGVSLNNNPSVTDPWNTSAAWMHYVPAPSPSSYQFVDGAAPYPGFGAGSNLAGVNAYMFWRRMIYAELAAYRTANRALSFMSAGINDASTTKLQGFHNPYWRLAYSREWGAHNVMIGTSGMIAHVYDDPTNPTDSNSVSRYKNLGVDAQYQYLLDPHTIMAQAAYMRQKQDYSPNTIAALSPPAFVDANGNPLPNGNPSDTLNVFRAKVSYVYQAKYGGSLSFFNSTGSTNTANMTSGYDPATGLITSDPGGGWAPPPCRRASPATCPASRRPVASPPSCSGRQSSTYVSVRNTPPTTSTTAHRATTMGWGATPRTTTPSSCMSGLPTRARSHRQPEAIMPKTTLSLALTITLTATGCANLERSRSLGDPRVSGATLARQVCSICHGIDGNSVSPQFPKLAGQKNGYLINQLNNFRGRNRTVPAGSEHMWGLTRHLSDEQIAGLADYYARQHPLPSAAGKADLMAAGKEVFEKGIPDQNVIACSACHGPKAEGIEAVPRLAGQHADYILKQLNVFQNTQGRPGTPMETIVHPLTGENKEAVATYLQGFPH